MDAYRWAIDGHEVARGNPATLTAPAAGEHVVTLTVAWWGQEVRVSAPLHVGPAAGGRADVPRE